MRMIWIGQVAVRQGNAQAPDGGGGLRLNLCVADVAGTAAVTGDGGAGGLAVGMGPAGRVHAGQLLGPGAGDPLEPGPDRRTITLRAASQQPDLVEVLFGDLCQARASVVSGTTTAGELEQVGRLRRRRLQRQRRDSASTRASRARYWPGPPIRSPGGPDRAYRGALLSDSCTVPTAA